MRVIPHLITTASVLPKNQLIQQLKKVTFYNVIYDALCKVGIVDTTTIDTTNMSVVPNQFRVKLVWVSVGVIQLNRNP